MSVVLIARYLRTHKASWVSAFHDPTLAHEAFCSLMFGDTIATRLHRGAWRALDNCEPRRVDWLMGVALLLRRKCLNGINDFDESEFMYGEDWDLCYRAASLAETCAARQSLQ